MVERWRQQHPLAHLQLRARAATEEDPGVRLEALGFSAQVCVRGDGEDSAFVAAFTQGFGFAPPDALRTAGDDALLVLWLGPSEWLLVAPEDDGALAERARQSLAGCHSAVTDMSDSRVVIRASGDRVRECLSKACSLDLHPRMFQAGMCAQSLLARTHVLLHQRDDAPTYDLYIHRSFADYAWRWLEDAALEYGLDVAAGT